MRRSTLALGVLSLPLLSGCGRSGKVSLAKKLDAFLRAETARGAFRGSVLVSRGGTTLLLKGYGLADAERRRPNTLQRASGSSCDVFKDRRRGKLARAPASWPFGPHLERAPQDLLLDAEATKMRVKV